MQIPPNNSVRLFIGSKFRWTERQSFNQSADKLGSSVLTHYCEQLPNPVLHFMRNWMQHSSWILPVNPDRQHQWIRQLDLSKTPTTTLRCGPSVEAGAIVYVRWMLRVRGSRWAGCERCLAGAPQPLQVLLLVHNTRQNHTGFHRQLFKVLLPPPVLIYLWSIYFNKLYL